MDSLLIIEQRRRKWEPIGGACERESMKFCEKCGSYMVKTATGLLCSRCRNRVDVNIVEVEKMHHSDTSSVDVASRSEMRYVKVNQVCPQCGNDSAFRYLLYTSGEHAGIKQERAVEHLKCTKCSHQWSRS